MTRFQKIVSLMALIIVLQVGLLFTSCTDQQLKDANSVVTGADRFLKGPAGQAIPPDLKYYGGLAVLIGSAAVNVLQKIKGDTMKKTTKAIVRGVEYAGRSVERSGNPAPKARGTVQSCVKASIAKEMIKAGVFVKGNRIVDSFKS